VLTFDDGYADNLHRAKPLLEMHGVPATAFIASGLIGRAREFWWDELERLVLGPARLPDRLHVPIGTTLHDQRLDSGVVTGEASARLQLYRELWELLLPLAHGPRMEALDRLADWSGADAGPRPDHRPLTRDEVVELARGGPFTVGAHTASHAYLSAHDTAAQRDEIERSRRDLEGLTGHTITHFAYPHGNRGPDTKSIVRAAGFECACGGQPGAVRRHSDPYHLPRLTVENVAGEVLAGLLDRVLRT
jgi:peptidoglycan/xylan/chitin deacetylase (PgdA/CDA1 family)